VTFGLSIEELGKFPGTLGETTLGQMAFQWLFKEISKTWGCRAGETTRQMLPGRSKVRRVRLTPLNMGRI